MFSDLGEIRIFVDQVNNITMKQYTRNIGVKVDTLNIHPKKRISVIVSIGDSPFTQNINISLKLKSGNALALLPSTAKITKESVSFIGLSDVSFYPSDKFYGVTPEFCKVAPELNKNGIYTLFRHVIPNLEFGNDQFVMPKSKDSAMQKKISKGTTDLKNSQIIAPIKGKHRCYFININYVRYGNILSYVKHDLNVTDYNALKELIINEIKNNL